MSQRSPDAELFDAVRRHSERVRGVPPTEFTVRYGDGSETVFRLPLSYLSGASVLPHADSGGREEAPAVEGSWPPCEGWAFRHGEFAFNGDVHRLSGRDHALLKALATAREAMTIAELRKQVWENYPVEDNSVRASISRLKARVSEMLSLPGDFVLIESLDGAYRLAKL
jgi:hypothetical protein